MDLKIVVAILAVILIGLLLVTPIITREDAPMPSTQASVPASSQVSIPSSLPLMTEPSTQPTTQPTAPPTTQPTIPATTVPARKPYSDDPVANAFINARLDSWICPLKDAFGEVVGSRTFGSGRSGGERAHAGLDFVAPHGTKVYAVTGGTVQRVAVFYQNTYAVEVKNDDGSVLRYCEIATDLKVGDYVAQGDLIGSILRADGGTEMLHMEVYLGDGEGSLTQSWNSSYSYVTKKNYMRRSDLIDPTFLKDLRQLS